MRNLLLELKASRLKRALSPFDVPSETSDVTLVVEDQTLYVNKGLLAVYSPVFQCMFNSEGFKEKDAEEVPLPHKTYEAVVHFLYQLYPVHSFRPITDENLPQILPLADEYQVEHVRQKCEEYIGQSLTKTLTADKVLLYLSLCERHNIPKHHDALVKFAERTSELSLLQSDYYLHVAPDRMKDILLQKNSNASRIRPNRYEGPDYAYTRQLETQTNTLNKQIENLQSRIRTLETERAKLNARKTFKRGWFFYVVLTMLVVIIFHSFILVSVSL